MRAAWVAAALLLLQGGVQALTTKPSGATPIAAAAPVKEAATFAASPPETVASIISQPAPKGSESAMPPAKR